MFDRMKEWYLCSPRDSPTIPVGKTICVGGGRNDEGGVLAGSGLGDNPENEDCYDHYQTEIPLVDRYFV